MSGADEIFELANDFGKAPAKVASTLYETFRSNGREFREAWQENARQTSGAHGKHYPDAITDEMRTGALTSIEVEVGPESGRKQGGMGPGFEFGSRNQPPHLDGLRALGPADAKLMREADNAIRSILP